jgi:hypothetical protein
MMNRKEEEEEEEEKKHVTTTTSNVSFFPNRIEQVRRKKRL